MNKNSIYYVAIFLIIFFILGYGFGYWYYSKSLRYNSISALPFQLKWEERELSIPRYEKTINYIFGQGNPSEVSISNVMHNQMNLIRQQSLAGQSIPDSTILEEQYGFTLEELEQLTYTGTTPFAGYNQMVTPEMEQALLSFLSSKSLRYTVENCYAGFVRYGDPMWRDDTTWINPHWININDFLTVNPYTGRKNIHYELIENTLYQVSNDNLLIKKCLQDKGKYDKTKEELESLYIKIKEIQRK